MAYMSSPLWIPEGSLAGLFVRHHLALELVCGAVFLWKLVCRAGPGDLGGSWGSVSAENPGKTGPEISSQIAFRYPVIGKEMRKTGQIKSRRAASAALGRRRATGRRARARPTDRARPLSCFVPPWACGTPGRRPLVRLSEAGWGGPLRACVFLRSFLFFPPDPGRSLCPPSGGPFEEI